MRAKVTYYKNRTIACVSGTRLAVIHQVRLLMDRGFKFRLPAKSMSSALITQFDKSDCWIVTI